MSVAEDDACKLVSKFREFDVDGNGTISSNELSTVLRRLAPIEFTDAHLDILMKAVDKNGDGQINYEEFVAWMVGMDRGTLTGKAVVVSQARHSVTGCFTSAQWVHLKGGSIKQMYRISQERLGEGGFGSVFSATSAGTGKAYAVKKISHAVMKRKELQKEVGLMKLLDHPNVAQLYEGYEDNSGVYLVMELCSGGELFDFIVQAEGITEQQVAHVIKQLLTGVAHLHHRGVCHRDLKAENFLLKKPLTSCPIEKAELKIIDFGCAVTFEPGKPIPADADNPGTLLYMPPERLVDAGRGLTYDERCDVWALGVTMFILIAGQYPFNGDTDDVIAHAVAAGEYELEPELWDQVSPEAKAMMKRLLAADMGQRPSAEDAIKDPWLQAKTRGQGDASDGKLSKAAFENMKSFRAQNKLKKAAMHLIARRLSDKELAGLSKTFRALDSNGDGSLTYAEMQAKFVEMGVDVSIEAELRSILDEADVNWNGKVDYTEFLASAMRMRRCHHKSVCKTAFDVFDRNGNGTIDRKELAQVLHNSELKEWTSSSTIAEVLADVDTNQDGIISFEEFMTMMQT